MVFSVFYKTGILSSNIIGLRLGYSLRAQNRHILCFLVPIQEFMLPVLYSGIEPDTLRSGFFMTIYYRFLRFLPALNLPDLDAAILISAPVWGLRPVRAARDATSNAPKPGIGNLVAGFE